MPGGSTIRVHMLDDSINAYEVKPTSYGNVLLQAVMKDLDILESDYFGAYYDDGDGVTFLDPLRQIGKQIKKPSDAVLEFGVKFFTPDPSQMQDEYTRYLFALQVKRDINTGKLACAENTAVEIASYIVQAEFGDWNSSECSDTSYLNDMKIFPYPKPEHLQKISELHRNLVGKNPAEADYSLLDIARRLELYGVRLYPALDAQNAEISLGVSHAGVLVFQGTKKINNFNWARIRKLSFKRKRFLVKLRTTDTTKSRQQGYGDILIFIMNNRDACKNFWKLCIEHHAFFRLEVRPKVKPKPVVLSRGSSFHYNGKTQKELLELVRNSNFRRTNFVRTTSRRRMHNSSSSPTGDIDAKKTRPDLNLQQNATNQSNAASPNSAMSSPSPSTFTDDQGSYRLNDTSRSLDTEQSITTTADITPDHSQRSQMPEWQLESKSLHSSATPIEGTEVRQDHSAAKGKNKLESNAWKKSDGVQSSKETSSSTVASSNEHSTYADRMRLAFKNSHKNGSHVDQVETMLQNVSPGDRESIISNTSNKINIFSGSRSLSFDPMTYAMRDTIVPPLPPKERQTSNEDGSYDNLKDIGTEVQDSVSSGCVSSSGFRGMVDRGDPFVNDSVVNLAATEVPMTPEVKAKIGEEKILAGHYAVPKKPPAPPEGEPFNSPRWNRTSQIHDKEINEAMRQLYQAINDGEAGNGKLGHGEPVCVDSTFPVVISSSDDENDYEVNSDSNAQTPLSPEEDPLLAPIKMEFDDFDSHLIPSN